MLNILHSKKSKIIGSIICAFILLITILFFVSPITIYNKCIDKNQAKKAIPEGFDNSSGYGATALYISKDNMYQMIFMSKKWIFEKKVEKKFVESEVAVKKVYKETYFLSFFKTDRYNKTGNKFVSISNKGSGILKFSEDKKDLYIYMINTPYGNFKEVKLSQAFLGPYEMMERYN